jgi:hypothetical protein
MSKSDLERRPFFRRHGFHRVSVSTLQVKHHSIPRYSIHAILLVFTIAYVMVEKNAHC